MSLPHIAFIGLGVMGGPMARNLARAGYPLSVYDLDATKGKSLIEHGARWAASVADAAAGADVVMTSLPGPAQVKEAGFAADGVLGSLRRGGIWIELSTNNRDVCAEIVAGAAERGIEVLDAPVSGGAEGSMAGTLTVLVGGSKTSFTACLPIFNVVGKRIEYLGPSGAGYAAKIAQVLLCYVHSLALSEALLLGIKGGVDPDKMLSIIQNSTGASYVAGAYGPPILSGDYDPSFTLGLALKDMRLARELAASVGVQLPLVDLTTKTYTEACERYGNDANHLKAVRVLEEDNGQFLRGVGV